MSRLCGAFELHDAIVLQIAKVCAMDHGFTTRATQTGAVSAICLNAKVRSQSNMLGAAILARTATHSGNSQYQSVARSAMEYSCSRQLSDGACGMPKKPKYHWIDIFTPATTWKALSCILMRPGRRVSPELEKGVPFFKSSFRRTGRSEILPQSDLPVDIQCALKRSIHWQPFRDYQNV